MGRNGLSHFGRMLPKEHSNGPQSPLLHIKLQWTNQPSISAKDISIYGCGRPLGHVINIIQKNFCSPVSHVLDKNSDL